MTGMLLKRAVKRNSEKGLTAIELLIAMTIFLIVMGSVYGLLKIGNMTRTTINVRTENIKNVRMAIDTIGREAVNAGLGYNRIGGIVPDDFTTNIFGLPADSDTNPDLLTAVSEGFNISPTHLSKTGEKNDIVAFTFRDFQFNDGNPIQITDATTNGSEIVLKTPDGACANCRPYDLFLIETGDGKKAVVLSTDIVNNNSIVLGSSTDPLDINYGVTANQTSNSGTSSGTSGSSGTSNGNCLLLGLLCTSGSGTSGSGGSGTSGSGSSGGNCLLLGLLCTSGSSGSSGSSTSIPNSAVRKCSSSSDSNCINYSSTTVVAKKIYLVSYNVTADGLLIRTNYANNTGEPAENQIVRQQIAKGVRSFKLKYLLSDGTVTEDPSVLNTQKERCNEIVQIEVTIVVESEINQDGAVNSEPITLTSTFSTRNLKYDVY